MRTLACGCTVVTSSGANRSDKDSVGEACQIHFEYAAQMVDNALSLSSTQRAAADKFVPPPMPDKVEPLDVYPIELHARTLHALVTAQLASALILPLDEDSREAKLTHCASVASQLIKASKDESVGR